MSADRYPAQVFWSDEDEGYVAIAPDLPGCSAFGDTEAQALAELKDAIEAWKQAAIEAGNPVPPPSKPAEKSYSGRLLLRMPRALHRELARRAEEESVSLNMHVVFLLTQGVTWRGLARFDSRPYSSVSRKTIFDENEILVVDNEQQSRISLRTDKNDQHMTSLKSNRTH